MNAFILLWLPLFILYGSSLDIKITKINILSNQQGNLKFYLLHEMPHLFSHCSCLVFIYFINKTLAYFVVLLALSSS